MRTSPILKLFTYTALTFFLIQGCKSKKHITSHDADVVVSENYPPIEETPHENHPQDNDVHVETKDTIVVDTVVIDNTPQKKDAYTIAVILPFIEDSVRSNWNKTVAKNFEHFYIPRESEMALSFYEGFLLALSDLDLESEFNLKIYDSKNDLSTTKYIAAKLEKEDIDVIIGPYASRNIQEIARVAKKDKIVHISPFSPSKSAAKSADNYFMLEPPFTKHLETMIDFTQENAPNSHIKYFYKDSDFGKINADYFTAYIDSLNRGKKIDKQLTYGIVKIDEESIYKLKIDQFLDSDINTTFIINSFNENLIGNLLQKINQLKDRDKLTVFGMPGWEKSQILRMSYLSSIQVHFTTSTWVTENGDVDDLKIRYRNEYKKWPSNDALFGYDVASLFINLIDKNGLDFSQPLKRNFYTGYSRNFDFSKNKRIVNSKIIENSTLHIYKIDNFERVLVK